jgi:Secretion system C-terminal sorting domain
MKKNVLLLLLLFGSLIANAQVLGGGLTFETAVAFNPSLLIGGCPTPSAAQSLSNTTANVTIQACAPAVCAGNTPGYDVWFKFYPLTATASIVASPTSGFNIAIQAFSNPGTTCAGLVQIGCVNATGNNQTETLNLTGLVPGTLYYFRIYGASSSASTRNGTYNFCGTAGLSATVLPVELSSLNATAKNDKVELNWTVESALDNSYFEIERSNDANQYTVIGKVAGAGTTAQTVQYSFTDIAPAASTNFYRLKLVDNNGSFKYSIVVTARLDGKLKNAVSINPNPVTDKINLKVTAVAAVNSSIKILNTVGQVVYQQNKKLVKGENVIIINKTANLTKGLYFLQVSGVNETLNTTVISMQ